MSIQVQRVVKMKNNRINYTQVVWEITKLLQEAEKTHEKEDRTKDAVTVESHCRNPKCISRIEQELTPLFKETRDGQRCVYCDCKIK